MTDPRHRQLAETLVGWSTGVRPGDRVLVAMLEPETFPLALAVHEAALRAGADAQVQFGSVLLQRNLLRFAAAELLAAPAELERQALAWADVVVALRGGRNPHEFAGLPAEPIARLRQAMGELSALRTATTRWTIVRLPNEAFATAAGLPLTEVEDAFWSAALRPWPEEGARWQAMADRLAGAERVRVVAPGTDLAFSVAGRRWVVGDGRINLPDGELYTAPVETSVEGVFAPPDPAHFAGARFDGLRLVFRGGGVVEATAAANEPLLRELLAMDPGARRAGEFGIGVNPGLSRLTGDILLDEKIAGTVHLALGRAYAECGGRNASALHWDIVLDLRRGGRVEVDGRVVVRDGELRLQ